MVGRSGAVGRVLLWGLVVGCGNGTLPGHYFDITVTGTDNDCTEDPPGESERYEYRVELAGNDVSIAIGEAVFATGTVEGCEVSYSSLVWSDYRDDQEIRWQISGEARVDVSGGDGCVNGGQDWEGTETIVVVDSAHPDVSAGCTYTMDVTGTWLKDEGVEETTTPGTTP